MSRSWCDFFSQICSRPKQKSRGHAPGPNLVSNTALSSPSAVFKAESTSFLGSRVIYPILWQFFGDSQDSAVFSKIQNFRNIVFTRLVATNEGGDRDFLHEMGVHRKVVSSNNTQSQAPRIFVAPGEAPISYTHHCRILLFSCLNCTCQRIR